MFNNNLEAIDSNLLVNIAKKKSSSFSVRRNNSLNKNDKTDDDVQIKQPSNTNPIIIEIDEEKKSNNLSSKLEKGFCGIVLTSGKIACCPLCFWNPLYWISFFISVPVHLSTCCLI